MSEQRPSEPTEERASVPGIPVEEIDGFLAWRLVRTGRAVERALTAAIADHDLSTTEFGVLSLLSATSDMSQSDLARAVLVRPQSVTPLLTGLVDRGLIQPRGPRGRGRRSYFDVTALGTDLIHRAWAQVTRAQSPQRFSLSERDAVQLARLLEIVETASPHFA